jgi:polysaccharide pyruvyl transferase WcaK-like protein
MTDAWKRSGSLRIALLGPYYSRNLGDTATQLSMAQNLKRLHPEADIVGISPDPADTIAAIGFDAFPLSGAGPCSGRLVAAFPTQSALRPPYPLRPDAMPRIWEFLRGIDVLVVSGGGQLDDFWGGNWGQPWTLLVWVLLARLRRVRVVYFAVGVDKIQWRLSRRFFAWGVGLAHACSVREAEALRVLRELGVRRDIGRCPDAVFAWTPDLSSASSQAPTRPFAVISPISRKTWSHEENAAHERYFGMLVELGKLFAARGLDIRIVCSQSAMDLKDAERLLVSLRQEGIAHVAHVSAPRPVDFVGQVKGARAVVASRLHGVILSMLATAPVLALAHLNKVREAMAGTAVEPFCFDLQAFDAQAVTIAAGQLIEQSDDLSAGLAKSNAIRREELEPLLRNLAGGDGQAAS